MPPGRRELNRLRLRFVQMSDGVIAFCSCRTSVREAVATAPTLPSAQRGRVVGTDRRQRAVMPLDGDKHMGATATLGER